MTEQSSGKLPVVLDAMGGDYAPEATVEGAIQASREFDLPIILVGLPDVIEQELAKHDHAGLPITIVPTSEVIEMTDHPAQAAKRKEDSSMIVGLNLVKSGEASAFVSMGNTGAVMAGALFRLGRIKGIKRPANSTVFPTREGHCFILDVGANAECRPEYLYQFAIMGSIYAERVLDIPNPRVGIISNGEEEGKGNDLVKETFPLLKESSLNFIGNVEGKDVNAGLADVVVTDGFTGNVLVKGIEGAAKMMQEFIREELYRSPISMLGGLLAKGAFKRIAKRTDYREYGGAALLGVNGVVIIGHGRSNARAVRSALRVASQAVERQVVDAIKQGIQ